MRSSEKELVAYHVSHSLSTQLGLAFVPNLLSLLLISLFVSGLQCQRGAHPRSLILLRQTKQFFCVISFVSNHERSGPCIGRAQAAAAQCPGSTNNKTSEEL